MKLSNAKLKRIWGLKKQLQMSEEELYLSLNSVCKTDSISGLTESQALTFIKTLEKNLPRSAKTAKRNYPTVRTGSNVIALATPAQREYAERLIGHINALGKYKLTLEGMSQKQFKKPATKLTRANAKVLTEALKAIYTRQTVGSYPLPSQENPNA